MASKQFQSSVTTLYTEDDQHLTVNVQEKHSDGTVGTLATVQISKGKFASSASPAVAAALHQALDAVRTGIAPAK